MSKLQRLLMIVGRLEDLPLAFSTGVRVADDALAIYQELKLKKKYTYIVYKMNDEATEIVVEKAVEGSNYETFVKELPKDACRYAVFDFAYETKGEGQGRNKILFFFWSPDTAKVKPKMVYAASKDALRKKLEGIYTEIQATDLSEVAYETVLDKVTR
ncbi:hypothetical protein SmJEL517_g04086 [Synchytrium microbalum]|uniref:Cofilin n=1 Tax=Synchytrium microbalum TaxID=1806994 RepID=A0A507C475_9FUNG|nr:uncharacterized protein SmJEL517_g04086 [Synchytrium microbalum]TPX32914.1 hypothetical protein SmJEL517_g04086 [Synchytrium microbalum]